MRYTFRPPARSFDPGGHRIGVEVEDEFPAPGGIMRRILLLAAAVLTVVALAAPAGAVGETLRPSTGTNTGGSVDVWAVARAGNLLVIGGNFTQVRGPDGVVRSAGGLAAMNATTGAWVWSASPGGTTYAIGSDGSSIWAGGTYSLRRYSLAGVRQSFPVPYSVGEIRAITVGNGRVHYAGSSGVAAVTTNGQALWRAAASNVRALALDGTALLVGGTFCSIRGSDRYGLARLLPDGTVDPDFRSATFSCGWDRAVLGLAVYDGRAYAAVGGTGNRLAAVSSTTGAFAWQTPAGNGDVQTVAVQDGAVYIGGHFDCVNGRDGQPCLARRAKTARYSLTGVLDGSWTPDVAGGFFGVRALVGDSTQLYAGGNFTRVNGAVRNKVAIFR
jgi:hypothetical protein